MPLHYILFFISDSKSRPAAAHADRRRMDAYSVREKQGLVPDLKIDGPHYELKGIRVDSSNANY